MLIVSKNTFPTIDLAVGEEVKWDFQRGCFRLKKVNAASLGKAYFSSPECNRDGIKSNGKSVDLIGVVARYNGCVLEIERKG